MSILYSEHLHIVNIFGETLQWKLIGIVSPYSEPLYIVNKMPLQIVFTIWRVDCSSFFVIFTQAVLYGNLEMVNLLLTLGSNLSIVGQYKNLRGTSLDFASTTKAPPEIEEVLTNHMRQSTDGAMTSKIIMTQITILKHNLQYDL